MEHIVIEPLGIVDLHGIKIENVHGDDLIMIINKKVEAEKLNTNVNKNSNKLEGTHEEWISKWIKMVSKK